MYTVYKTVNLVNKKFYIGVHKTENPMDNYLGSGKLLKAAIKKHGVENFKKEILFVFQEASDAFAKEAELVTKELIESGVSYNLKLGGEGGFDWINERPHLTLENKRKGGHAAKKNLELGRGNHLTAERKRALMTGNKYSLGTKRTKATRELMSEKASGSNSSQYGRRWYNNGIIAKKIKGDPPIGWVPGRKINALIAQLDRASGFYPLG